jgi:hypothetical protein
MRSEITDEASVNVLTPREVGVVLFGGLAPKKPGFWAMQALLLLVKTRFLTQRLD